MKQRQTSSGRVRKTSLRKQFQKTVPNRAVRVLLIAVAVLLLLGVLVGIVSGGLAIARCGTGQRTSAAQTPQPIEPQTPQSVAEQPVPTDPGTSNDTVVLQQPTEPPATEIPLPELPAETEIPATPEPVETPAPTESTDYLGGKTYRTGDTNPVILDAQARLMDLGYMDPDEPTEAFGDQLHHALIGFQQHNGLTADGVLNEQTYALLIGGGAKEFVMQEGDTGDDVKEVQDRLYELGYLDYGSRNGTFGETTAAAVRSFQSTNRLKVDGKVGAKTLNTLYSGDVIGNYFKSGDSDDSIIPLQKQLQKLGYLDANYACKGKMDGKTVSAIKLFQEANGLVRDGCLGPATTDMIRSGDAIAYAMRLGMSGSDVRNAQKRLSRLGYISPNQITGYYGETTAEAVMDFQKRNNLAQDGEIGARTLEKLNSDKAKAAPNAGKKTPTPKPGKTTPTPGEAEGKRKGVEKLIKIAEEKLGSPYVRGAKGPDAFDCSGFVYWCLNQAGIKQAYMTSIIWRTCSKYKRINAMGDLKRGDILVFRGETMESGHVGIYLGDGKMIDASSSRGQVRVTETNILKSVYWQEHFLMAYRIWA